MSLNLEGAKPVPIVAGTLTKLDGTVELFLGEHQIPLKDFRALVMYVMCGSKIVRPDDPRLDLLKDVKDLTIMEDERGKRFSGLRPFAKFFSNRD